MSDPIIHKQGTTFRLDAQWLVDGVGDDITGDTFTCKMVREDYSYTFSVSPEYDASGEFVIFAPKEDTALWPIGVYDCDIIRNVSSGENQPTQTFQISVIPSPSL